MHRIDIRPRRTSTLRLRVAAAVVGTGLVVTGCFGSSDEAGDAAAGSLADDVTLEGAEIAVGGKEFTEQLILCEITALALESTGADVSRECGLSGSDTTRAALTNGDIDVYWEYTGTAWISYLEHTDPVNDPDEQLQAVADEDGADNGIVWLDRAPFNNTYAIATADDKADELGVTSLSEYAELANTDEAAASMCVNGEFSVRNDGLPGVQEHYGFELPSSAVQTLEEGAILNSISKSDPCNFGMVATTDGRIPGMGLTVLDDDQAFFPVYNPAGNVRQDVLDEHPEIADVANAIAAALTTESMQEMNGSVDIDGETPEDVAKEWLQNEGFIG